MRRSPKEPITMEFLRSRSTEDSTTNCLVWVGAKGMGYGRIKIGGVLYSVHRIAYELTFGPIPDDLHVLHHCDNRACWNPEHLFLGDNRANVDDMLSKNRQLLGSRANGAKLTEEDIPYIRELVVMSMSKRNIARLFGVEETTIRDVIKGETWSHV